MRKNNIRISDAIPTMPASFDRTVERTLNSVCTEQKKQTRTERQAVSDRWVVRGESARTGKTKPGAKQILAFSAVAVLLVAVFAIGAFVLRNALYSGKKTGELAVTATDQPATEQPAAPNTPSPAIRCYGLTYLLTDGVYTGEVNENELQRAAAPAAASAWPTEDGQANFGEEGMCFAMTPDGLVVQIEDAWRFCEPYLPDPTGLFEAAYAQAISEQDALNRERTRLRRIGEEAPDEAEANEFFIHQRLVRLQWICDTYKSAVPVKQTDDDVRLDEIAAFDGKLYFAFAAPAGVSFDFEPVIRLNGNAYSVIDDTGFFVLAGTETEQYAFCEISTGRMKGTRTVAVELNGCRFCFQYDADAGTVTLPENAEAFETWFNGSDTVLPPTPAPNTAAEPGVPCAFVTAEQYVSPYAYLAYSEGPGSVGDAISLVYQMQAEGFRSQIPIMTYHDDLAIESPNEIVQINVYDENGARIAFDTSLDYLKTLAPGLYYVSALVRVADGDTVTGYDCVCGVAIGITAPQEPDASATPKPDLVSAVRFNGTTYLLTDEAYNGSILMRLGEVEGAQTELLPSKDNCANFGEPGMGLALVSDGLVVDYGGWKRLVPNYPQMDGPAVAGYTVPAIRHQGVLYLWAVSEDGNAFSFNDEYICYSLSSAVSPGQWPTEEEQINFDGLGCKVAKTKDGLLIEYEGGMLLFRPVLEVPAVFRQGSEYIVPSCSVVSYSSPEYAGDGFPLAMRLNDADFMASIPTVQYSGKPIDVTPRGWTIERVYMIDPDGDRVWEATEGELELLEECYELPMTPLEGAMADNEHNNYYLCARVARYDGDVIRYVECAIRIAL